MKILKIKFIILSLLAALAASVFLTSCEQGLIVPALDKEELNTIENQRIMDALCSHSHDNCDIDISATGIMVDNCFRMDKENFLADLDMLENGFETEPIILEVRHLEHPEQTIRVPLENMNATNRQGLRGKNLFVPNSIIGNLTYYIRPSIATDCHADLFSAINDAAAYWSNIEGCRVNLTRTLFPTTADIILGCDTDTWFQTLTDDQFNHYDIANTGFASWPFFGGNVVGKYISINDEAKNNALFRGLIMHEIGHCLGLTHPNEAIWHIPGTPVLAIDDTDALMIGNTDVNDMSAEDLQAFRRLWPDYLRRPTNVSYTKVNNGVRIQLQNPDPLNRPYDHVNVLNCFNGNCTSFQSDYDADGNYNFIWSDNFPAGKHMFYIYGASHNDEVMSPYLGNTVSIQ